LIAVRFIFVFQAQIFSRWILTYQPSLDVIVPFTSKQAKLPLTSVYILPVFVSTRSPVETWVIKLYVFRSIDPYLPKKAGNMLIANAVSVA